jgi:hypothetical protein
MTPAEYAKKKMQLANKVKDCRHRYFQAVKEYEYFIKQKSGSELKK